MSILKLIIEIPLRSANKWHPLDLYFFPVVRCPRWCCPPHNIFVAIDQLLRETRTFISAQSDGERSHNVYILQMKENIPQCFTDYPLISTRVVAAELDAPHTAVWNVLHTAKMYPSTSRRYNFYTKATIPIVNSL
ncbi:hypothetical protein NPIL_394741 [Nephila pilipes]|uniref:Uncharacterized protein n=1 Tax=Nephila pilipes TaxID=299642 RepID=A0A8X6UDL4_NEPPI|nr:hypothetical protein NPIL_394741 [Nephila pilipes]